MSSVSDLISNFSTVFTSVFTMVTDNWLLSLIIFVPIGLGILGGVVSIFKH